MMARMHAAKLEVRPFSRLFKALGDDTRLRIVALLSHGELCVCHIQEALGITQSNASRHLSVLRAAGIVEDRREGTWVYYRLTPPKDPDCARALREIVRTFAKRDVLRRDVAQLLKTRGPGACR
jgi:ArsR family transcriptional regulator, arsenate/arsenite/antimonite-responsive transcriptional repressor